MIAEMPPKSPKNGSKPEVKEAQKNPAADPLGEVGHDLDPAKFVSFPDSPYQLYQPFPPAGDQPGAIDALVEGVEDGLLYLLVDSIFIFRRSCFIREFSL